MVTVGAFSSSVSCANAPSYHNEIMLGAQPPEVTMTSTSESRADK
jgi:hypothetical protein